MMRVVLDVNVLVSGFPAPGGVPGRLIVAWLRREFELALSEHILRKVADAWMNPYFRARYHEQEAQRALALLQRRGTLVTPVTDVQGIAPDEEDDIVLATAVAGRADYLATGDIPFRSLVDDYRGIVILTPREFLDLLEQGGKQQGIGSDGHHRVIPLTVEGWESRPMVLEPDEPTPEGFSDVLDRLRMGGIRARFTCIAAPVQLEGQLPSGERFYFRCRYTTCSLGIAAEEGDPVGDPFWHQEVTRWEGYDAGYLEPEEAEAVFRELLAAYIVKSA